GKPLTLPSDQNCRPADASISTSTPANLAPSSPTEAQPNADQALAQSSAESPIPCQTDEAPPTGFPRCSVDTSARGLFSWELCQKYCVPPRFRRARGHGS